MNVADECRALGLSIGDTIFGREEGPRSYWHEARLTLLWLGKEEAMWSVQTRSDVQPEWSEPHEQGDWMLSCRDWRKVGTSGVAPSDKVQMPDKARAGIEVLHRVVESLLTTSRYVDEEGEATQALADLSDCIADPPFRAPGVALSRGGQQ